MKILINHVGYNACASKKIVVQTEQDIDAKTFDIIDGKGNQVYSGDLKFVGTVRNWDKGVYYVGDFSCFKEVGKFRAVVDSTASEEFEITEYLMNLRLANAATAFFKGQRSSGWWDFEDSHLKFAGPRKGVLDVHGGWFDASGDHGIHLSHLSHSTYYNPQQAGFSVYTFFKAYEQMKEKNNRCYDLLFNKMLDEGFFGADFLMRMHAPSGSFFRSIRRHEDLDALDVIKGTRTMGFEYHGSSDQFSDVAATAGEETINDTNYETSLRSGGALAIAALAIASRYETCSSSYTSKDYLKCACDAWNYLKVHNCEYANDGKWNFVDYYTSLICTVELYKSTGEEALLADARAMAENVIKSTCETDRDKCRFEFTAGMPYHHASDEGMPVLGLIEYALVEPVSDKAETAISVAEKVMRRKLDLTHGESNPFNYPIIECLENGKIITRFFFPHHTAVAPWWQGENARLASIASASRKLAKVTSDKELSAQLYILADDCIDWIFGQNPYDSCMMEGYGRNNPQYFFYDRYEYLNCPGGIVNGITSKDSDEDSIDFVTEPREDTTDNWRWAEQWIPHVSWYLYAESLDKV